MFHGLMGRAIKKNIRMLLTFGRLFMIMLPENNNSKIPTALQGIMLQSQLYGRARDLCRMIPTDVIQSPEGANAIVNAVFKRDPLAIVSEVYQDFFDLLNTKRGQTETFKNFESGFEAQCSKFNSHSDASKLPDALLAFMLMANANLDGSTRISVLAASAPCDSDFTAASTTADF